VVARDASGNFSAGTITADLTGNASTASALTPGAAINGTTFTGSSGITITAATTHGLGLANSNLAFSSGTTWDGGTTGITLGLSATPTSITSINGVTLPTSGSFVTSSTSAGGDLTGTYPDPTLAAVGTAGTYSKVTTDSKGRVTAGTSIVTYSATAPVSPAAGDLWYCTEDGTFYTYYTEVGTASVSSQWVQIQGNPAVDTVLTNRVATLETVTDTTNKAGLVPVIPTSVAVGSGSASVAANGLVTFTGASSILLNGVFSATHKNYVIYFSAPNGNTNTAPANVVYVRFATGGVANTTSSYTYTGAYTQGGGASLASTGRGTASGTNVAVLDYLQDSALTLYGPFETRGTSATFINAYAHTNIWGQLGFNASTSFDGIQFFNNTYTGTARVYGLRN
jgi:hypothetical protein